mmetsp:Transcript_122448/g.332460  ORF Transcript_122448/g.332460 Transcript_122448/m.332460 type:complete len:467 (-) Transcript_122448:188-1588(-)
MPVDAAVASGLGPSERTPLVPDTQKAAAEESERRTATLRLVATAGAGLVADGYDLSVINISLAILTKLYPESINVSGQGLIACMTLIGVVVGQVTFGTVADILGRRRASIATAVLVIAGALLSACVSDSGRGGISLQLMTCRLLLGLGVGGEYPLSAAISKEAGHDLCLTRPQLLIVNVLMFNVGVILQAVLVLSLLSAGVGLEAVWRLALACGAVPSVLAFALRLQMHEPEEAAAPAAGHGHGEQWHEIREVFRSKWHVFTGACVSWMLFNFVGYGQSTFSSIICEQMLGLAGNSVYSAVSRDAWFALVLGICAAMGNLVGFVLEAKTSRCGHQLIGFAGMATCNLVNGTLLGVLPQSMAWLLVAIFCVNAVAHAQVGITTYLVPTESFPAVARGTCVGLSAACGKVGAAVGTGLFPTVQATLGLGSVMTFCGGLLLFACVVTWNMTPRGGDLAKGSLERQDFRW